MLFSHKSLAHFVLLELVVVKTTSCDNPKSNKEHNERIIMSLCYIQTLIKKELCMFSVPKQKSCYTV